MNFSLPYEDFPFVISIQDNIYIAHGLGSSRRPYRLDNVSEETAG